MWCKERKNGIRIAEPQPILGEMAMSKTGCRRLETSEFGILADTGLIFICLEMINAFARISMTSMQLLKGKSAGKSN